MERIEYVNVPLFFAEASERLVLQDWERLLQWAVKVKSSDVHIEPQSQEARIRIRLDGLLQEVARLPVRHAPLILSKLKTIAGLDIAEKRQAQDGRFEMTLANCTVSGRLSTCPTLFGEKAVLRLFGLIDPRALHLEALGLEACQLEALQSILTAPHGLVVVTGPTGSGKSLTLYTLLNQLNSPVRNIISVEDPIEMVLEGVNQVQIHEKSGVAFNRILRHLLRQDPDVMMIGEIRDQDTAEIAVKAAQTGHLVLCTLHTASALGVFSRLEQLGVPPYLILESASLFMAQRLVRLQGKAGRTGIFELIKMDAALKEQWSFSKTIQPSDYVGGLDLKAAGACKLESGRIDEVALREVLN